MALDTTYEQLFLGALCLTVAIETLALFIAARKLLHIDKKAASDALLIFCGAFLSFATLPYVWFIFPAFTQGGAQYIAAAELFAFSAEAAAYAFILRIGWKQAAILSFICNAASFLLGLLFFR